MFYYKIYGEVIESDLYFRQLVECDNEASPSIFIRKKKTPQVILEKMKTDYTFLSKDESWFHNSTVKCLIKNGCTIDYDPIENYNHQYLCTYILGYGLSMLFLQRDKLAIHSSCVRNGENAILISGVSGAGKSTLTSKFLANGYGFMADDITVVSHDGPDECAYPCFPFQKLCRDVVEQKQLNTDELIYIDEEKDKFLVRWDGDFLLERAKIDALVVIHVGDEESELKIEVADGFEKLQYVVENLFLRRPIIFKENNPQVIKLCLDVASRIKILVVTRPFGKDTSEEQFRLIEEKIEESRRC